MAKKTISLYANGIVLKSHNRRITIQKHNFEKFELDGAAIQIKSLTKDTSDKKGAVSVLSKNKKVKYSFIGLSDEAVLELHAALSYHIKQIMKKEPLTL